MKILVTGARGFIGKNLVLELKNRNYKDIFEFDIDTDTKLLDKFCREADFVFHLAGVNRPKETSEFMEGNFGFTSILLNTLKKPTADTEFCSVVFRGFFRQKCLFLAVVLLGLTQLKWLPVLEQMLLF